MKLKITKYGRVWHWEVRHGQHIIGGGYCATKRDAANDGGIFMLRSMQSQTIQL
jgi:predicted enzyme related to lactoylglutathione lyase